MLSSGLLIVQWKKERVRFECAGAYVDLLSSDALSPTNDEVVKNSVVFALSGEWREEVGF